MIAMTKIQLAVAFYCDPFTLLLEAWYRAEGGTDACFIKAIRCSFPKTATIQEALARAGKTFRNRALAWQAQGKPLLTYVAQVGKDPYTGEARPRRLVVTDDFIGYLGSKIAPLNVANDPSGLNRNWVTNVQAIYRQLCGDRD